MNHARQSDISTKINLDATTLLGLTGDDLFMLHKKVLVNKYIEEKTNNTKKSVASIAKDLGVSKSTLDRYKSDISLTSTRKTPLYSAERKREITMKSMATKKRNQLYKEELRSIMSDKNLSKEDLEREMQKLRSTYSTHSILSEQETATSSKRGARRGGAMETDEMDTREYLRALADKINI